MTVVPGAQERRRESLSPRSAREEEEMTIYTLLVATAVLMMVN